MSTWKSWLYPKVEALHVSLSRTEVVWEQWFHNLAQKALEVPSTRYLRSKELSRYRLNKANSKLQNPKCNVIGENPHHETLPHTQNYSKCIKLPSVMYM